jgi:hypothetical protein
MNHLVFLDAQAGELEKILSGVKTMVVKNVDPTPPTEQLVRPGDDLFFVRNNDECAVRVKATVVRVLTTNHDADEDVSHILKELQPRLQLTEDQYNYWSGRKRAAFIEFEAAGKIPEFLIAPGKIIDRTRWIAFEEIPQLTEEGAKDGTSKNFIR